MKYMFISDIHGSVEKLEECIKIFEKEKPKNKTTVSVPERRAYSQFTSRNESLVEKATREMSAKKFLHSLADVAHGFYGVTLRMIPQPN